MHNKGMFGGLLEFPNQKEMELFIDSLDKDSAVKILEMSINHCIHLGVFDLSETFCLYKSLSKLKEKDEEKIH